jgi:predicted glycoside hydrolase/deacetylase ChbG (UPF0249 family)
VRRLIINADDFGLTTGVNRGIADCCRTGVATSTTLMANSKAFDQAVQIAGELGPKAGVGCHVMLVDGAPLLPAAQVSSLLDNGSGEFRRGIGEFALGALRGKIRPEEMEAEAVAQIRKAQAAGVRQGQLD